MSLAVIVCASGLPDWWQLARRRMAEYAESCGAEFVELEFKWYGMLSRGQATADAVMQYDRSLVLDADIIIRRGSPNIFAAFPEPGIYMALDTLPGDEKCHNRFQDMAVMQAIRGSISWTIGYGNSGVILCDKRHHTLWRGWVDVPKGLFPDQANINYLIQWERHKLNALPREWNSFGLNSGFTEHDAIELSINALARDCYFAHPAGLEPRGEFITWLDKQLP